MNNPQTNSGNSLNPDLQPFLPPGSTSPVSSTQHLHNHLAPPAQQFSPDTPISSPHLPPSQLILGMPSNKFADQTVAEAQVAETAKQQYGDELRRQMLEKQQRRNDEQQRKVNEDRADLERVHYEMK